MSQLHASAEVFRSSWSAYDAIIENNYMSHREIHARIREVLGTRAAQGDYQLLDLGCGNARLLADTLRVFPPARYLGVDLSSTALAEAAVQLKALPAVELREQDMLTCAAGEATASFDVVYSSFAMHHLAAGDKQRLFQAIAGLLTPGGEFLLIDVMREEGQSREKYLENYLHMMRTEWTAVDRSQLEEICAHVSTYDFPETFATLKRQAAEAGLERVKILDRFGPHHVLVVSQ